MIGLAFPGRGRPVVVDPETGRWRFGPHPARPPADLPDGDLLIHGDAHDVLAALARTRAGAATNANCDPIPSRKVRAPRRRDDDALYVGVDPQPSAAASAARYPACRAADRADAVADPRPTLLVD